MKPLKPSHRERKRYLLVKGKDVNKKVVDEVILEFVGVLGYAEASPQVISFSKKRIVLAVNRKSLDKIRASFLISGKDLEIVKISGSVRKLK